MARTREEWRPWPGAPDYYEVSSRGRVRSLKRKRGGRPLIRRLQRNERGYMKIAIPGARTVFVHLMVLEAFVGPRPHDHEGDHGNRNRADNRLENLQWLPREVNRARRDFARGSRCSFSAEFSKGHQCDGETVSGDPCRGRAYVRVDAGWLCGSHLARERRDGDAVELERWAA